MNKGDNYLAIFTVQSSMELDKIGKRKQEQITYWAFPSLLFFRRKYIFFQSLSESGLPSELHEMRRSRASRVNERANSILNGRKEATICY